MKKNNAGFIVTVVLIATVVAATLGISIFAGVVAMFSDNGEETTSAQTEQVQEEGKTTEGSEKGDSTEKVDGTNKGDGTENGGDASETTKGETTTAADAFEQTETIVFPEIPEED